MVNGFESWLRVWLLVVDYWSPQIYDHRLNPHL